MHFESILDLIQKGGFTVYVLIICSIVSLKVAIDKWLQFQGIKESILHQVVRKTKEYIKNRQVREALEYLNSAKWKKLGVKYSSPLSPVFVFIIENSHLSAEKLEEGAFNELDKELVSYERGLGIPGTLGSITPFIGLFGTVVGIIKSFAALSVQGNATNYSNVISGIAEALIATATGLFVAIPSVMIYNYFAKRLKLQMPFFDGAIRELIYLVKN